MGNFRRVELPIAANFASGDCATLNEFFDLASVAVQLSHQIVEIPGLMFHSCFPLFIVCDDCVDCTFVSRRSRLDFRSIPRE